MYLLPTEQTPGPKSLVGSSPPNHIATQEKAMFEAVGQPHIHETTLDKQHRNIFGEQSEATKHTDRS